MLETVKRGEDDKWTGDGEKTVILRLYEHFGGHARAALHMWVIRRKHSTYRCSSGVEVKKAEIVNLLEDHVQDLKVHSHEVDNLKKQDTLVSVNLDFRGYEIKTVRLTVIGDKRKKRDSGSSWVKL
jgi:alpha-mannosidase